MGMRSAASFISNTNSDGVQSTLLFIRRQGSDANKACPSKMSSASHWRESRSGAAGEATTRPDRSVPLSEAAERWPVFATPTGPVGWHPAAGRAA